MPALASVSRRYREDIGQHQLVCGQDLASGEVLAHFRAAATLLEPSRLTVQVSATAHILLDPAILGSVNHSCDPNTFFDTDRGELVSLLPIPAGEELTYFYPSTEWDMAESFSCSCGARRCLGMIQGARYVPLAVLLSYRLALHIQALLASQSALPLRGDGQAAAACNVTLPEG